MLAVYLEFPPELSGVSSEPKLNISVYRLINHFFSHLNGFVSLSRGKSKDVHPKTLFQLR